MNILNKHIDEFPLISIPSSILKGFFDNTEEPVKGLRNLSKNIVVFSDFKPLSNWFSPLKGVYKELYDTSTDTIRVRVVQYSQMKICTKDESSDLVYVKKSTIPGAGKGLFINKTIPKDTYICIYIDSIAGIPTMEYSESYFINHSKDDPNVKIKMVRKGGCVRSMAYSNRIIHKGEELFLNYLGKTLVNNYPYLGGITF